jgi:FTR1 family protein
MRSSPTRKGSGGKVSQVAGKISGHAILREHALPLFLTPAIMAEIVLITFSAIFREGLETVIFLLPMTSQSSLQGTTIAAIAGIAVGIAFGIMVLYVGKKCLLDPTIFFMATAAFVFFIAVRNRP